MLNLAEYRQNSRLADWLPWAGLDRAGRRLEQGWQFPAHGAVSRA